MRPAVKESRSKSPVPGSWSFHRNMPGAEDEGCGNYATAQDEAFYQAARAPVPDGGRERRESSRPRRCAQAKGPVLIPADAVAGMASGSVIIDPAADRGGNLRVDEARRGSWSRAG